MKKYISIFTLALLLIAIPLVSVKAAEPSSKEQKKAYKTQVQEKKKVIHQKTLDIKKMQSQFGGMADDMLKAFENILTTEIVPNEDFVNKVQTKQEQIFNTLIEIGKLEDNIKIKKLEAKVNADKEDYSQALLDYDNVISLLEKEEALLKSYTADMQEFVELIKSLQYK